MPYYSDAIAKALVPHQSADAAHSNAPSATATFLIPDMDCPACATGLRAALEKLPGVREATVDAAALRAAELGKTAAMTEVRTLGGTCVNRGCLPSKN